MASFKIEDYFIFKNVTPSSMQQDNILQFSYRSPNGVHDTKPLTIVTEKLSDRFYGINLNYDMRELNEAVTNLENKLLPFLEKAYYKKYPDNKKKLNEEHIKFTKSLITEVEYHEFMKTYPKKDLEQFEIRGRNMDAMRCYRYDRMTAVSKLIWKT